jgi:hypothetical protein
MGDIFSHSENVNDNFSSGSYKSKKNPRPGYYMRKERVYYRGTILKQAEPKTFQKLGHGWARDVNNIYKDGEISKSFIDPRNFKLIGNLPTKIKS